MVAMDIHFEVDGEEVEPYDAVYVVINALGLLPESADPGSVSIQHHVDLSGLDMSAYGIAPTDVDGDTVEGDTEAPEVYVEPVAGTEYDDGVLDVEAQSDVKAAFEVQMFSTFTITFNYPDPNFPIEAPPLTIHLVDEDGVELQTKLPSLNFADSNYFKPEEYKYQIFDGFLIYDFVRDYGIERIVSNNVAYAYASQANLKDGTAISLLRYDDSSGCWVYNYGQGQITEAADIYLKYSKVPVSEQPAYFYVVKPASTVIFSVNEWKYDENANWYYAGQGTINYDSRDQFGDVGKNFPFEGYAVTKYPNLPETITIKDKEGKDQTYYLKGSDAAADAESEFVYSVKWVRFKTSSSTTTNEPALDGSPTKLENKNSWHVDGYLILHPMKDVQYFVYDKNGKPIPGIGDNGFVGGTAAMEGEKLTQFSYGYSTDVYDQYFKDGTTGDSGTILQWYVKNPDGTLSDRVWNYDTDKVPDTGVDLYAMLIPKEVSPEPEAYTLSLLKLIGSLDENGNVVIGETPLADATFKLTDGDGVEIEATTDANGRAEFTEVAPGTYTLTETAAPSGYTKLPEGITVTIDDEGKVAVEGESSKYVQIDSNGETPVLKVANIPATVKVRFVKTDGGSNPLAEAHFELYEVVNSEEVLFKEGISNGEGNIFVEGVLELRVGTTYHLKETQAPDGYVPRSEPVNIMIQDNGTISVTPNLGENSVETEANGTHVIKIPNNPGTVLPSTGGVGTAYYVVAGIGLMGAAALALLAARTRRKGHERA